MFKRHFIWVTLAASVAVGATNALAESSQVTGAGSPLTTSANLDFRVNIPGVLRFRIGTAGAAIDNIIFDVPAANVGDGTDVNATSGGDVAAGQVTVQLFGNRSAITLTPTVPANLSNGTDTMPYTEIKVSAATGDGGGGLSPNGATRSPIAARAVPVTSGTKITNRNDVWTFVYDNAAGYPAGTYGGVNTNGSRVTWTASMP